MIRENYSKRVRSPHVSKDYFGAKITQTYVRATNWGTYTIITMHNHKKTCPKCGSQKIKSWPELTDEQKMLARSLPASAEYPLSRRKKHRFCTRCWYEEEIEVESRA